MADTNKISENTNYIDAIMTFAPHVGVFVLAFSTIDVHLSRIISYVYPRCAAEGVALKMPRELTKKIGQVRRAFAETGALVCWKPAMLSVLADIESIKNTRDLLSHGAIATNALHLETLYFQKVDPYDRNPTTQIEEVLSISKSDMRLEAQKALRVAAQLLSIVADIMDEDSPHLEHI